MATTADRLALLQRTKAGQRALLEGMYPDLDFSTVPFREYGRLFTGRKYVPGFVGGWKTYGRSNSEDPATREVLPDYSGNGRDIRLYNFAFAGMSGYGGYVCDFNKFGVSNGVTGLTLTKSATRIRIEVTEAFSYPNAINMQSRLWDAAKGRTVKVTSTYTDIDSIQLQCSSQGTDQDIALNGKTFIPAYSGTVDNYMYIKLTNVISKAGVIDIELLPEYPGALVSDGIDDYGQCVKDFALPNDYTVVAVRKIIQSTADCLVAKTKTGNHGAFIFDYSTGGGYSYGTENARLKMPALFSYQTKTSYNGQTLNVGTATDTDEDKLMLFTFRPNDDRFIQCALYDLRIYDHSLTAEELEAVKDEMMQDYENATGGGITDITYVADWDGKGRSNDEEADVRSKWIDKATGKVINLSNYSFSEMSGWGGYPFDWIDWMSDIANNGGTVIRTQTSVRMTNTGNFPGYGLLYRRTTPNVDAFKIRVTGLKDNATLFFYGSGANFSTKKDGVYTINYATPLSSELNNFRLEGYSANEETDLLIEQLPLYPGALVFDGVDDEIQAEEALGEVGTVLIHWKNIGLPVSHYLYNTGWEDDAGRLYCWNSEETIYCGIPHMEMDGHPIMVYHRSPTISSGRLSNYAGDNNCPIFRLIFIKEQLDDTQQEFLKWKVEKEYRDWCRANGYEYAINQLTE